MRFFLLSVLISGSALFSVAQSPASVTAAPPALPAAQSPVWMMEDSGSMASLRGIDSVDGAVAWASGSEGTVLRTTDGGAHWTRCATPDGDKDGAKLDFRGVQAWDAKTAIVMASGPGELSRLYKTTNGCRTWKLIFQNPDKDGFFDAIYFPESGDFKGIGDWGSLLGDPVDGMFTLFETHDAGQHWIRQTNKGLRVKSGSEGAFAASNSSLLDFMGLTLFGSGGTGGGFVFSITEQTICLDDCSAADANLNGGKNKWDQQAVPLGGIGEGSGVFSIGSRAKYKGAPLAYQSLVIVGGDYTKPNEKDMTAAFKLIDDKSWTTATTPPHGYRSAVQWSASQKAWITVGTNGSDMSRDDGKTWSPLDDGNWNALSLPFVVGPKGRIARLNPAAISGGK